jgi:hypothetical protein
MRKKKEQGFTLARIMPLVGVTRFTFSIKQLFSMKEKMEIDGAAGWI